MLVSEARWLGHVLSRLPEAAFPLLHIGSSSADFRSREQPWIERDLFHPLASQGRKVVHVDLREAPGVDLVADVTTPDGLQSLAREQPGALLCANILEHVADPTKLTMNLLKVLRPGGYVILTAPRRYPPHADPLDNGFRPNVSELIAPIAEHVEIVEGAELRCHRIGWYYAGGRQGLPRLALRMLAPWYRPRRWLELVQWSFTVPLQSCVVARIPVLPERTQT